jgi:predicted XRE-type DNA-binding protein
MDKHPGDVLRRSAIMNKRSKAVELIESSGNLFRDVGFPEEEARKLQFRSFLMIAIKKYIRYTSLTQKEAAKKLGVTQSRISHLMHGRIDLFSIDMLLDMLERAGFKIYEKMEIDIIAAINQPAFHLHAGRTK